MTEIIFSDEFAKEFSKAREKADKGNGEAEYIVKIIERGISKLYNDHEAGQKIERKLWPKAYIAKYSLNNLWRLRLDDSWRMIYTMRGPDVKIVALVLDVMDHRDYDKLFGYR
jgi:hypothetical protein